MTPGARERIRAAHCASGRRIAVLDDDPTGSQCVNDVDVVLDLETAAFARGLAEPGSVCFGLTNSRSMPEQEAFTVNRRAARSLFELAADRGWPLTVLSRSDSTLRGHLIAETRALDTARQVVLGHGFDGVLLVPAYLEAGRVTVGSRHWAWVGGRYVPVAKTEFARDATFGYHASDLRDHVVERAGGELDRRDVRAVTLTDIRSGGPDRVADVLASLTGGAFAVVDALTYADLEAVALGLIAAEGEGRALLPRCGPSFVRALAGIEPRPALGAAELDVGRGHGLVVVGSHVGLTNRQVEVARDECGLTEVVLDVPGLLDAADLGGYADAVAEAVREALASGDVLLVTSRSVAAGTGPDAALGVARTVSAAVADVVRAALPARPAWIVAKGGITSHDVAVHGLHLRRATVMGQLYPGLVSVFRPVEAAPEVIGVPYVVFAGNVGDDRTLADVVTRLRAACS